MGGLVLAGTFLNILKPWPLKFLFDDVLIPGVLEISGRNVGRDVLIIALAIVSITALGAVISFLREYLLQRAGQQVAYEMRTALHRKIHRLSLSFHDGQRTGDLITSVTKDVDKVQEFMTTSIVDSVSNALTLIGMTAVMLTLDWPLTLAMMLLNPALFILAWRFRRAVKKAEVNLRVSEGDIASMAQETISSIRLVKAFGREEHEADRFEHSAEAALKANLQVTKAEAAFGGGLDLVSAASLAALLWFGAWRVLNGALTPGELLIFTQYSRDFNGPARSLSRLSTRIARASVRAGRIVDVLELESTVQDLPDAGPAPRLTGRLQLEHVDFAYVDGYPVLSDVEFDIAPGQVAALVGHTGAGKSTIAALVARLYDPTSGRVLVDGKDVRSFQLESLQKQISFVLQESVLFRASIRENIAYGKPDATNEEVVAAAKTAGAHSFIEQLPAGYSTVVGERGETLSGGQRQRIAIARAVVRDAPILILDEPTTGLDAQTEREVLNAFDRLMEGRTTLLIAHQLGTIRHADQIMVLDKGQILERGSHDELIEADGRYAELWRLQTGKRRGQRRAQPLPTPSKGERTGA